MSLPLSNSVCEQLRLLTLLHKLGGNELRLHSALLEKDEVMLESLVQQGMAADLWEVGDDEYLLLTSMGWRTYQKLLHRQQAYLIHLDIFCAIDLTEGVFGEAGSRDIHEAHYSDLRIAIAKYKGINVYKLVFLAMLADGTWYSEPGWQAKLALDAQSFEMLDVIVKAQIGIDELGYKTEDGEAIDGEAVLQDVILQGAEENLRRLQAHEKSLEHTNYYQLDEEHDEEVDPNETTPAQQSIRPALTNYDPWAVMHEYTSNPHYAEPLWLEENWLNE